MLVALICVERSRGGTAAAQGLREDGGDGDSYVPGHVSFPATADRIVQITAGELRPGA